MTVKYVKFEDGYAINGTFPDDEILRFIQMVTTPHDHIATTNYKHVPLVIADPPYGNIVDRAWDKTDLSDVDFCRWMIDWSYKLTTLCCEGAALYCWGGVGKPQDG